MKLTDAIINYRRYLKRRNYSAHTVKNYLSQLKDFVLWLDVPLEKADRKKISAYIDHLRNKRLAAKTINCHLHSVRRFYNFLADEDYLQLSNPVQQGTALRMARPLPKHLTDEQVIRLFSVIGNLRDRAMFLLMLRCGLRVEEVANLTLQAIDWRRQRLYVFSGKGSKDRVVFISNDTYQLLATYIKARWSLRVKKVFLVEKGRHKGRPISVRGIQKRLQYYAQKSGLQVSCHQLRHTMATQMLNADAALVTIQELLGHSKIKTTQRYCKISNLKVQRDYFKAMEVIMRR
jgi:site-specific recombinase XerD